MASKFLVSIPRGLAAAAKARDRCVISLEVSMRFHRLVNSPILICTVSLVALLGLNGCGSSSPSSATSSSGGSSGSSSTTAYVYVTNQLGTSGVDQIMAYSVDANGQLTAVPGSPFDQNVGSIVVSGSYLLGSSQTASDIDTYIIGSNGALMLGPQFNYGPDTGYSATAGCGGVGVLRLDRTGQSLYAVVGSISCSDNEAIASFALDSSNGTLSYLGNVNIGHESSGATAFLGNDEYAYTAFSGPYWNIDSFVRNSNGLLTGNSGVTPLHPIAAPPGATSGLIDGYTPGLTATDSTNHVAMVEFPDFTVGGVAQPTQLAVYTAEANGQLSTSDTYATMPTTAVTSPMDLEASPSGTILAVGGEGGLQLFHFNGASSITSFTNVLTTDYIAQVAWDNSNHLYAITWTPAGSTSPGKLYVYTVTDSGATEAPGSPYTITIPRGIAVQSE
jgi:hypothetical protein